MKKTKPTDTSLEVNPFIKLNKLQVVEVTNKITYANTADITDGIISKYKTTYETFQTERDRKTSVYHTKDHYTTIFRKISSSARTLYLYIIYELGDNKDFINLNLQTLELALEVSRPTACKMLRELEDIAVISLKARSVYWVNPAFIFRGNRLAYYQEYYPDDIDVVAKQTLK